MRFPSQIPRSRRSKAMRLAVALAALAVFAASVLGLAYALKPAPDEVPDEWSAAPTGLRAMDPARDPARAPDATSSARGVPGIPSPGPWPQA